MVARLVSTIALIAALLPAALPAGAQNIEIPIGAVIDWWRPTSATPFPDGFVIADGRVVSDNRSPLNGMAVPDLRDRFVKGARDINAIGQTGGSRDHSHRVDLGHVHKWGYTRYNPNDGKTQWLTWTSPFAPNPTLVTLWNNGIGDAGSGNFPMAPWHPKNSDYYTGQTFFSNKFQRTEDAASEPPYVGLLKIVKVR